MVRSDGIFIHRLRVYWSPFIFCGHYPHALGDFQYPLSAWARLSAAWQNAPLVSAVAHFCADSRSAVNQYAQISVVGVAGKLLRNGTGDHDNRWIAEREWLL